MSEFVLEIYSEEIPSKLQEIAANELFKQFSKALVENNIRFGSHSIMSSPRRIAIFVQDMPQMLEETIQEFKGPKKNSPIQAIEGFAKNHLVTVEELELKNIKDSEIYFYYKKIPATRVSLALANIIPHVLKNINWQKSQKWDDSDVRWIRPVRSILCLLNDEVVKFNFGNISSSNYTFGHRFMMPEKFLVKCAQDYIQSLEEKKVLCFADKRKHKICEQIIEITKNNNLTLIEDDELLSEVNGLVEYPNALLGYIDEKYMSLPPEVLITSMRHHQKIFCLNSNGKLSNKFITIANVVTQNDQLIIEGNQKVVAARLADAQFFWQEDCKKTLEEHAEKLNKVIFHKNLGSIAEKSIRIGQLAKFIASKYLPYDEQYINKAAAIIKADLVTEMVGEFPELQGIIGKHYAKFHGEEEKIYISIEEHYKPLTQYDNSPSNKLSIILSLADKIDSLVGLWAAGEKPTGSKDPYALRRSALTIIKLILDTKIQVNLEELIAFTLGLFTTYLTIDISKIHDEISEFIKIRLKQYFKNNMVRNDIIEAFVNSNLNICMIEEKISLCSDFISSEFGKNAISSIKRVINILEIEGLENINSEVIKDLLTIEPEVILYNKYLELENILSFSDSTNVKSFENLIILSPLIDNFFDQVIVNDPSNVVRQNRIALLQKIKSQVAKLGDFSKLEV